MVSFRRASLALSAVCVCLLVFASAALASGPTSVTVRVEGANATLVPPTVVTTTIAPMIKDGDPEHSCPGTSALGALQLATGGNWSGPWEPKYKQYVLFSIDGENHEFGSGAYWDLWINHKYSEIGACEAEPETGQEILLFPCSETAAECPSPLGIEAPASADIGEVPITVEKYSATGQASPVAGASVTDASSTTEAGGHATLNFPSPGEYTVQATAPGLVRDEVTICVHNANEGACGASGPSGSSTGSSGSGGVLGYSSSSYKGPYAVVAKIAGLIDGHRYAKGRAPRVLSGKVLAHTGVASVSLRLRRSYKGRCYAYNGASDRFGSARCGEGSFFKVGTQSSFSYLLPEALRPGRYVLDVQATDAAGNRTTLARGSSRVVFYVG